MDDFEFNNLNKDNNVDSHENEDYKYPENMSLSDYSDEQGDSSTKNMDNPGLIENSEKKDGYRYGVRLFAGSLTRSRSF